jgi:UTP:GlnB (protein PII) uridylyltransferase
MTVGERAEDVFYVSDARHGPLAEDRAQQLIAQLTLALDRRRAA